LYVNVLWFWSTHEKKRKCLVVIWKCLYPRYLLWNVDRFVLHFLVYSNSIWSFPVYTCIWFFFTFHWSKRKGVEKKTFLIYCQTPVAGIQFLHRVYLIFSCLLKDPNIWLFCLSLIFSSVSNILFLVTIKTH